MKHTQKFVYGCHQQFPECFHFSTYILTVAVLETLYSETSNCTIIQSTLSHSSKSREQEARNSCTDKAESEMEDKNMAAMWCMFRLTFKMLWTEPTWNSQEVSNITHCQSSCCIFSYLVLTDIGPKHSAFSTEVRLLLNSENHSKTHLLPIVSFQKAAFNIFKVFIALFSSLKENFMQTSCPFKFAIF
jgi:hypothetical protein